MSSVELYHKLRNHLRIEILHNDYQAASRIMREKYPNRHKLHVKCSPEYLWGGYYARVGWGKPSTRYPVSQRQRSLRYDEFCTWYGLEMEAA